MAHKDKTLNRWTFIAIILFILENFKKGLKWMIKLLQASKMSRKLKSKLSRRKGIIEIKVEINETGNIKIKEIKTKYCTLRSLN